MFFGRKTHGDAAAGPHATTILRDVVEVVAIVAAGAWAFYVFIYQNRILPSFAEPDVNITASMQRLSERNGLIAVGLRTAYRNVGSVKAHFTGIAVNVYGQRITPSEPRVTRESAPLAYDFEGFYRIGPRVPVYAYAYVTQLGNPKTGQDIEIDPGTMFENYRTFYVPQGRFQMLTVCIDAPFTKYENKTVPTHLAVGPYGNVKVVTQLTSQMSQYGVCPVASLDVR
ncbi:MAG TPA: hypothetical protein VFF63_00815 [Candidatus Babeliales bacterium]|nr:hypothetical protein [Candidatus Babeliales bacterium]